MLDRFAAVYVALKLVFFTGFALSVGWVTAVQAQVSFGGGAVASDEAPDPTVCTGENLVLSIGREFPDAMARIDAAADAVPFGQGKFWRLERDGLAPSYLYGTMHVADERATELSDAVRSAISGADTVALELAEIADPDTLRAKMAGFVSQSLYLDGTTLGSRLEPDEREQLETVLASRGPVPWAAAQRMRPWLLMSAMSVPACEVARKAAKRPIVDQLIAQIAQEAGRDVVGLETVEGQITTIASLPEPLMLRALVDVARLGERMDDVFETTVALYESGETAKIWTLLRDPVLSEGLGASGEKDEAATSEREAGYAAFQASLIDRRNATMVEALEPLMKKGNAFAGVGALHLPGEKGMLKLLQARGWRIAPLD